MQDADGGVVVARMGVLPALRVVRSEPVTARMQRVTVGGAAVRTLEPVAPAAHLRLLFGEPGDADIALPTQGPAKLVWPADRPRPFARSMTVRHVDREAGELAIDVALHGVTAATRWVTGCRPGDPVGVVGPGGGYTPPADARYHLLAGDETALPAIATVLAALPRDTRARVFVEVHDAGDEQPLEACAPADTRIVWVHRARGLCLEQVVRAKYWPGLWLGPVAAWVAGEGHAVRRIREYLRLERGLDRAHCHAIRYWTRGRTHEDSDVTFGAARAEAARRGIALETTQDVHEMSYELMTGGFRLPNP